MPGLGCRVQGLRVQEPGVGFRAYCLFMYGALNLKP